MSETVQYATPEDVQQALATIDLSELIFRMESFASSRMKGLGNVTEPMDLVAEVLTKIQTGERKWPKGTEFKPFAFSVLKSVIDNFYGKSKTRKTEEITPELAEYESTNFELPDSAIDYQEISKKAIQALDAQDPPPTAEESFIFELWLNGIHEPRKIAQELQIHVEEVYNGIKRLKRRLPPVQNLLKAYFDEKK